MAVERVEQLLRDVTTALDASGIRYAVVGGTAVAAWVAHIDAGAVRATKDAITPEIVAKLPPDLQQRCHQLAASPA